MSSKAARLPENLNHSLVGSKEGAEGAQAFKKPCRTVSHRPCERNRVNHSKYPMDPMRVPVHRHAPRLSHFLLPGEKTKKSIHHLSFRPSFLFRIPTIKFLFPLIIVKIRISNHASLSILSITIPG